MGLEAKDLTNRSALDQAPASLTAATRKGGDRFGAEVHTGPEGGDKRERLQMDQNRPQGLRGNRGERWQMDHMATGPEEGQGMEDK